MSIGGKKPTSNLADTPDLVEDLGCWTDTNNRVMSSLEDQHAALTDYYKTRTEPYEKCFRAALDFGKFKICLNS